jgi:hypothetical protein
LGNRPHKKTFWGWANLRSPPWYTADWTRLRELFSEMMALHGTGLECIAINVERGDTKRYWTAFYSFKRFNICDDQSQFYHLREIYEYL